MRTLLIASLALGFASAAHAQSMDELEAMEAQMNAAQMDAERPGDEQLSCDQLQAELGTTMSDPAVQASVAANGAIAQEQMDRMRDARGPMIGNMGVNIFMGLASSFIPGMGYAQMGIQAAQAGAARAQMAEAEAQRATMMANLQAIMPQMMRGQRIVQLAQAQQCAFLQGAGMPPEDFPEDAPRQ
ncbi:MAG: hypothetical protein AB7J28_11655 [Hyphomonadaceae bacterium]